MKLTVREAARVFDVSERTLWRWIASGRLETVRRRGKTMLTGEQVDHEAERWRNRNRARPRGLV